MTTDTTALQERIARALYENAEYYGPAPTQPPWEWRDDEERGEWMEVAAAVLPIIAAEVQAASEKAWEEGWEDRNTPDGYAWDGEQDVPLTSSRYDNPYCATEYETGERA